MKFNKRILQRSISKYSRISSYAGITPSIANQASLMFNAKYAEGLQDIEAGTLYFRDSNFNRVGATFSRTTTATRVNKQGLIETVAANVPRIDYTDGSAKLLMEPSRTNVVQYSEDIENAYWNLTGGIGAYTATDSPDGDNNATNIAPTPNTRTHWIAVNQNPPSGLIVATIYARKADSKYLWLSIGGNSSVRALFNLELGTLIDSGDTGSGINFVSASIKEAVNGYYRCILVGDNVGGIGYNMGFAAFNADTLPVDALQTATWDGTGLSIDVYGAQLEQGSYPTSYIPTSGSAVTRNEDTLSQGGLASILPDISGTWYFNIENSQSLNLTLSPNTLSDRVLYSYNTATNEISANVIVGGTNLGKIGTAVINLNTPHKNAISWENNLYRQHLNGAELGRQTGGSVYSDGTLTHLRFDNSASTPNNLFYGKLSEMIIFPTALTDSELEQLTT